MKDKFAGIAKVGEKGQIVIPKEARDMFNIKTGDSLIVLCDKPVLLDQLHQRGNRPQAP